jgi:hypothetical protein
MAVASAQTLDPTVCLPGPLQIAGQLWAFVDSHLMGALGRRRNPTYRLNILSSPSQQVAISDEEIP